MPIALHQQMQEEAQEKCSHYQIDWLNAAKVFYARRAFLRMLRQRFYHWPHGLRDRRCPLIALNHPQSLIYSPMHKSGAGRMARWIRHEANDNYYEKAYAVSPLQLAGNSIQKRLPSPNLESTPHCPPNRLTPRCMMASPNPEP